MSSLYPIKNPIIFLAFGLGSGLSPKAPGTAGSALALIFFPLLVLLGQMGSLVFIGIAAIFGNQLLMQVLLGLLSNFPDISTIK